MSQYYNPPRNRNIYVPKSTEPFTISRSKIDLYVSCQRCFYIDVRLGISRPPGFPFTLNNAVDELLKKEFDIHRAKNTTHPLMAKYGLRAVPFRHEKMEEWRDALRRGIKTLHKSTNLYIRGGIDDVWEGEDKKLMIVDYKATSKKGEVSLDAEWQDGYKRQMEIYQWLFRENNFDVNDTGYFVYVNATTDREAFDGKLEFSVKIIPYIGKTNWIEETLSLLKTCIESDSIPEKAVDCDYCLYRETTGKALLASKRRSEDVDTKAAEKPKSIKKDIEKHTDKTTKTLF